MLFQILISALVFAGVFLPVWAVFRYPVPREPPVHRSFAKALGQDRSTIFEQPVLAPAMSLATTVASKVNIVSLRARVRQDLSASGNPSGYSVNEYLAICIACAGLGAVVTLVLDLLLSMGLALFSVPLMTVLGFFAPLWVLRGAARLRMSRVGKQLPYTLDLVALVMAAGSSFAEAAQTLIRDDPDDDLNQELQIALNEIEFGTPRGQALENMADRVPVESLRSVVGAVNQAEKLGTPLSTILKLQADMMRMHRGVRAEKLSASASLRILIPSMLILLAVVTIVFAPMVIQYIEQGSLLG